MYNEGILVLPIIKEVLSFDIKNKNDLAIAKRVAYRRVYGSKVSNEYNNALGSISSDPMLDIVYNKVVDDMAEAFVLKNVGKNLNITFEEFMKYPIEKVYWLLHAMDDVNKRIINLKEEADESLLGNGFDI